MCWLSIVVAVPKEDAALAEKPLLTRRLKVTFPPHCDYSQHHGRTCVSQAEPECPRQKQEHGPVVLVQNCLSLQPLGFVVQSLLTLLFTIFYLFI